MKVQVVSGAESAIAIVKKSMSPLAGSVAAFAVVVVLVVFILLERKRVRDRFLRLDLALGSDRSGAGDTHNSLLGSTGTLFSGLSSL